MKSGKVNILSVDVTMDAPMKQTDPFRKVNPISATILTPREREVLHFVVKGFKNGEIAGRMGITVKTVEKHRKNMMEKLQVRNLSELFRVALKYGLMETEATPVQALPGTVKGVGHYYAPGEAKGIAVCGRYAYLAHGGGGLKIIDVGNPAAPVLIGSYQTDGDARGVAVSGSFVYLADTTGGLKVFDVSNPARPMLTGQYVAVDDLDHTALRNAYDVSIQGTVAYVAYDFLGLQIVDVSDPANPRLLKGLKTPSWAYEFSPRGTYGYLVHSACGLLTLDISVPEAARQVGALALSGNPTGLCVHGRYACIAAGDHFHIVDVALPSSPKLIATYDTPGQANKVFVKGACVYIADGPAGVQILDVSDPHGPKWVGTYDTLGNANDLTVSNGLIYVSDGKEGMVILEFRRPHERDT